MARAVRQAKPAAFHVWPPVTFGPWFVPCEPTFAVRFAPNGSVALTVAVLEPSCDTLHVELAPDPEAQPDQVYVIGSPSGSLPDADTFVEHGAPGRGWHEPPPDALTVGAELVPVALPWALAEPQEFDTVIEHAADPGWEMEHVPFAPLPLQQPPHWYWSVAEPEAAALKPTVHGELACG